MIHLYFTVHSLVLLLCPRPFIHRPRHSIPRQQNVHLYRFFTLFSCLWLSVLEVIDVQLLRRKIQRSGSRSGGENKWDKRSFIGRFRYISSPPRYGFLSLAALWNYGPSLLARWGIPWPVLVAWLSSCFIVFSYCCEVKFPQKVNFSYTRSDFHTILESTVTCLGGLIMSLFSCDFRLLWGQISTQGQIFTQGQFSTQGIIYTQRSNLHTKVKFTHKV